MLTVIWNTVVYIICATIPIIPGNYAAYMLFSFLTYGFRTIFPKNLEIPISNLKDVPDRTVQMAAKALILRAYISLFRHRSSNSTHIIKKPIASRLMYANSDITESHRTPTGYESEIWTWALVNFLKLCNSRFTAHENLTLCFSRGQLDEAPAFLAWKIERTVIAVFAKYYITFL